MFLVRLLDDQFQTDLYLSRVRSDVKALLRALSYVKLAHFYGVARLKAAKRRFKTVFDFEPPFLLNVSIYCSGGLITNTSPYI